MSMSTFSHLTLLGQAPNPVRSHLLIVCSLFMVMVLPPLESAYTEDGGVVRRIALGSCANERRNHVIWEAIVEQSPDLFLFLGDNVYADTEDMALMRKSYDTLGAKPGYQALLKTCPVVAVWDDHDYGVNDGGAEFPAKEGAEKEFHRFFQTPEGADSLKRPGIYDVRYFAGPDGEKLQVIQLDTRYFRSPLVSFPKRGSDGPYDRNRSPDATILGADQWKWLEKTLHEPADLRIIMTSIQFLPQEHHWELWENFPLERERMLGLLKTADTGPVLFVSGDRHMAEIMELKTSDPLSPGFPVYEMTSSGLTNAGGGRKGEPNRHRISPTNFQSRNFGLITIDWKSMSLLLETRDVEGNVVDSHLVSMTANK